MVNGAAFQARNVCIGENIHRILRTIRNMLEVDCIVQTVSRLFVTFILSVITRCYVQLSGTVIASFALSTTDSSSFVFERPIELPGSTTRRHVCDIF
jgi:hypothetical protein